ncbi:MAG: LuxR C-terminal-related transcriptional regulator [Myxococcales bacterium]|nr:LuxR C-terminal-related transcriptional regulator [Myxococcales bacterium]
MDAAEIARVLADMNCGVVRRDRAGHLVYVNDRMASWLGYSPEELIGRPAEFVGPPEVRPLIRSEMDATEEGDGRARVVVFQRKDGTTFPVMVLPSAQRDADGQLDGSVVVVVDLGTVQTAKQVGLQTDHGVRARLDRIALELQAIGLAQDQPAAPPSALSHPDLGELSAREREVLGLLLGGERVATIAPQLFISPHTVRNHLKSLFRKMGVGNQAELIAKVRALASD